MRQRILASRFAVPSRGAAIPTYELHPQPYLDQDGLTNSNLTGALPFHLLSDDLDPDTTAEVSELLNSWRPHPWLGQVWYNHGTQGQNSVWARRIVPHEDKRRVSGAEYAWLPQEENDAFIQAAFIAAHPPRTQVDTLKGRASLTEAFKDEWAIRVSKLELNAAYEAFRTDPAKEGIFWELVYGFCRSPKRLGDCRRLLNDKRPEVYLDIHDIFADFALELHRRMASGQYTHIGTLDGWIAHIWDYYYFKGVQQEYYDYPSKHKFLVLDDGELERGEEQEIGPSEIREASAFSKLMNAETFDQVTPDKVRSGLDDVKSPFFALSAAAKEVLRGMTDGLGSLQIAKRLDISRRHALRRMEAVTAECTSILETSFGAEVVL